MRDDLPDDAIVNVKIGLTTYHCGCTRCCNAPERCSTHPDARIRTQESSWDGSWIVPAEKP